MKIDRELQHRLLQAAADMYPMDVVPVTEGLDWEAERNLAGQLFYLAEHGLIENASQISLDGLISFGPYKATKDGIDFIADDGGLGAVLGVVTIKLHEDTLKSLIEARIHDLPLDPHDKNRWIVALQALPAETTKHLVLKLLDVGMRHGSEAIHTLGTYLGTVL